MFVSYRLHFIEIENVNDRDFLFWVILLPWVLSLNIPFMVSNFFNGIINCVSHLCYRTSVESLYILLGVPKGAPVDDVKKAYRKVKVYFLFFFFLC